MRKYQKAAVAMAMLGSVSFLGAGVGNAADGDEKVRFENKQNQGCEMNSAYEGILGVDDIAVNVNLLLAHGDQDASEKQSQSCSQGFKVGDKKH
jgi:hypothetical protein